jgi:transmembrane sensor
MLSSRDWNARKAAAPHRKAGRLDNGHKPSRQDEAAAWFAAQRAGVMLVEQRAAFDQWRRDPRNQAALDAMQDLWEDLAVLKATTPAKKASRWSPRAMSAAALVLIAVGGGGVGAWLGGSPQSIETRPGQQATQSLPDGSLISVNVASRVTYRISDDRRVVTVSEGEAAFSVKADEARPFLVRAGDYEVRATGTAFNVRERDGLLEVAVSEGRVEICAAVGSNAGVSLVSLGVGQKLRLPSALSEQSAGSLAPASVAPEQVAEWRMRVVTYENVAVRDLVEDFNRYFDRKLSVDGEALRDRRVTIRLQVEDRERAIAMLAGLLDVRVERTERGEALRD